MALENVKEIYTKRDNGFYRNHYHHIFIALMVLILSVLIALGVLLWQMFTRPLPVFNAVQPDNQTMTLIPFDAPNVLPDTIIRFASKAAVTAYTFDFVNYADQIVLARSYFTDAGWQDFLTSINKVIATVKQNQLFVYGVVIGAPVISNQGELPDIGYAWRVQIPFLVTYVSSNPVVKRNYYVIMTIVRVPTSVNPQGIGIDQFVMV
jgi:intracellular multiplication protein IcmL